MKHYIILLIFLCSCVTTSDYQSRLSQGNDFLKAGLKREAIESFQEAIAIEPQNPIGYQRLGLAFFKSGDYLGCVKSILKSFPQFSKDYESNFSLGECHRILGAREEALKYLQLALKINRKSYEASRSLSWIHWKVQNYKKAKKYADYAFQLAPENNDNFVVLLRVYFSLNLHKEIEERFRNYSWDESHLPVMWALKGDLEFGLGDFERASLSYKEALKKNPFLRSAILGLANCLMKEGKVKEAEKVLENGRKILQEEKDTKSNLHAEEI